MEKRTSGGDAVTPPSLLLVRFAAIGDCVMAAWTATAYRNKYPSGELVWAIDLRCRPVVDEVRLTSGVAEFPRDRWKGARWSPATWREQLAAYSALRRRHFDWGLDLQGHSKTALALRIAKPRRRLAVGATDAFARRLNPVMGPLPPDTHTVERNHTALLSFAEFELPQRPTMPGDTSVQRDPNLVTISVGAGSKAKMWQAERWQAVATALMDRGLRVALLGGRDDPHVVVPGADDLVDRIPLADTMAWVSRSVLHLAADTGTGHMAAAYGVPVVSVFGPSDDRRYRPYTAQGRVLRRSSQTQSVTVDEVLAAADEWLMTAGGRTCVS